MKLTSSEEKYWKTIFHLQLNPANVLTMALSEPLHTRPALVTDMMKKMNSQSLPDDLADKNIFIGTQIEINKRSAFDQSVEVKIHKKTSPLAEQMARHVYVK